MSTIRDPIFGCEIAQGRTDHEGYVFWGKSRAHIAAWQRVNGVITALDKEGNRLELDHGCRRRACVRLVHLELVTRSENEKRKSWKYRAKQKQCKNGHDMAINAMVTPEGGRVCRTCSRSEAE